MRHLTLMAFAILMLGAAVAAPSGARAEESVHSAWTNVWGYSAESRALDLSHAEKSEFARRGGYGAGNSYADYFIAEQNNTSYHYGDQISSNAMNVVNSNSTENRTTIGDNNTSVMVIPTATATQTSGTATQGATTQTTVTDTDGTTDIDVSASTGD